MNVPLVVFDRPAAPGTEVSRTVTLAFGERAKARLRARCDDGTEVAISVERGQVLRDGTLLADATGSVLRVVAALETLSEVVAADALNLARAAYHLGNRHVPLEVRTDALRYQHDHVLDEMVRGLGFSVHTVDAGFEPEAGAYSGGGGHHHSH